MGNVTVIVKIPDSITEETPRSITDPREQLTLTKQTLEQLESIVVTFATCIYLALLVPNLKPYILHLLKDVLPGTQKNTQNSFETALVPISENYSAPDHK